MSTGGEDQSLRKQIHTEITSFQLHNSRAIPWWPIPLLAVHPQLRPRFDQLTPRDFPAPGVSFGHHTMYPRPFPFSSAEVVRAVKESAPKRVVRQDSRIYNVN